MKPDPVLMQLLPPTVTAPEVPMLVPVSVRMVAPEDANVAGFTPVMVGAA